MSEFPTFFSFDVETTATVVEGGDVEMAIECMGTLDTQRRRLDRMQAVPPARREP
jgi:hypothetical protein